MDPNRAVAVSQASRLNRFRHAHFDEVHPSTHGCGVGAFLLAMADRCRRYALRHNWIWKKEDLRSTTGVWELRKKKTEYREDYLLVESYVDECFSGLVKPSSREQSESCAIFPGGLCDLPRATVSGPQTQLNKWRECLLYTSMGYSWGRIFLIGGDRRRPRRLSLRLSPRSCKSQRMRSRLRR